MVRLPAEKPKHQAKNQADEQAGGEWEIKAHVLSLDDNVAGEPAQAQLTEERPQQTEQH